MKPKSQICECFQNKTKNILFQKSFWIIENVYEYILLSMLLCYEVFIYFDFLLMTFYLSFKLLSLHPCQDCYSFLRCFLLNFVFHKLLFTNWTSFVFHVLVYKNVFNQIDIQISDDSRWNNKHLNSICIYYLAWLGFVFWIVIHIFINCVVCCLHIPFWACHGLWAMANEKADYKNCCYYYYLIIVINWF